MLHPLIHIVMLIVLAGGCAGGGGAALGLGAAVALGGVALTRGRHWRALLRGLRQLRYLFVSLLVLYGWFQPGPVLFPALGGWSPTLAGLAEGALRAGVLVVMVAAVHGLMHYQGEGRVVAGLLALLAPLSRVGVATDRFALRLVLAMRLVPRLRELVAEAAVDAGGRWQRRARLAGAVFTATMARAETATAEPVAVPAVAPPPRWQWLLPMAMGTAFWGLA